MWNLNTKATLVIMGATGTNSKSFRQYLKHITAENEIKELQNNSHIGHCTYTAESANVTVQNTFNMRNSVTCRKIVNTERLQYCISYEHGFFFRHVIVNILLTDENK